MKSIFIPSTSLLATMILSLTCPSLFITQSSSSDSTDLISKTCNQTPYPNLCISSLESNPQSSAAATTVDLARIMIDIVAINATDTLNYIRDLIRETMDPAVERALAICAEIYGPAVKYYFPDASRALARGDPKFASYNVAQASKGAGDCEKGFNAVGSSSPITDRNKIVHDLSVVASSIVDAL